MNEKDLSAKVLETIKEKKLKPRAKWQFVLREVAIIIAGAALLVVGSISFSAMIYRLQDNDYSLYMHKGSGLALFVLASIPYFWILAIAALLALLFYILKNTRHGYRYRLPVIVIFSVLGSFVLGLVLFWLGIGYMTESVINEHLPAYNRMVGYSKEFWLDPDDGSLAGEILQITPEGSWLIVDNHGDLWLVYISDAEVVLFDGIDEIESGFNCTMVGDMIGDGEFKAEEIHVKALAAPGLGGSLPCCE